MILSFRLPLCDKVDGTHCNNLNLYIKILFLTTNLTSSSGYFLTGSSSPKIGVVLVFANSNLCYNC